MKLAIITGGSSGLGLAMTGQLVTQGWSCITIQRSTRGLGVLLEEYGGIQTPEPDAGRGSTGALEVIHQDLSALEELPDFLEGLFSRGRDLVLGDVSRGAEPGDSALWLILNAATLDPIKPLAQADPAALEAHMALNLLSPMLFISAFERILADIPGGLGGGGSWKAGGRTLRGGIDKRIIAVSSGAALHAYPGWSAYCASKAGLDQVMDAAAQEAGVSGSGTFFRAIAPGVVDTPMQEAIRSRGPEQFPMVQRFRDLHASGGLASPEGAAAKLLSLAVQGEEAYLRLDVRTA